MRKNTKIALGIVAAVLVVSAAVLGTQSQLFQGRLKGGFRPAAEQAQQRRPSETLFNYSGKVVSAVTTPVTSPVTSVVISEVTSPEGISAVASAVTSPVASPVASAVAVSEEVAKEVNVKQLRTLTGDILDALARADFRQNQRLYLEKASQDHKASPERFTLSDIEKQQIVDLYKQTHPSEFIIQPMTSTESRMIESVLDSQQRVQLR